MGFSTADFKMALRKCCWRFGYDIIRREPPVIYGIPDEDCYHSLFNPWDSPRFFPEFEEIKELTVCSRYSAWAVMHLLRQTQNVKGDIIELGVYKGGIARLLAQSRPSPPFAEQKSLRLFDTFTGMPDTNPVLDRHKKGDFSDTSLEAVRNILGDAKDVYFYQGLVEDTLQLAGIEMASFVHIDLDIHAAIKASVEYFWPRLSPGGIIVFDDYGFPTCPGARKAVDDFFTHLPIKPFLLPFGSCFVQKSIGAG